MGRIYYVGWFQALRVSHCEVLGGETECPDVRTGSYFSGEDKPDVIRTGLTRLEALERGWALCPVCDSESNRKNVNQAEEKILRGRPLGVVPWI
jgi:hypothetical protein